MGLNRPTSAKSARSWIYDISHEQSGDLLFHPRGSVDMYKYLQHHEKIIDHVLQRIWKILRSASKLQCRLNFPDMTGSNLG